MLAGTVVSFACLLLSEVVSVSRPCLATLSGSESLGIVGDCQLELEPSTLELSSLVVDAPFDRVGDHEGSRSLPDCSYIPSSVDDATGSNFPVLAAGIASGGFGIAKHTVVSLPCSNSSLHLLRQGE